MEIQKLLEASPLAIFEWATGKPEDEVTRIVMNASLFIHPEAVRRKPVQYPNSVRSSKIHHSGKKLHETSKWQDQDVKVRGNLRARMAFGRYINRKLNGKRRDVAIGWDIAHIWGRVYDPEYFTAGWNIVLIPSFLRVLTEEQSNLPVFSKCLQSLAWRLFFEKNPVAAPKTTPVVDGTVLPRWLASFEPRFAGGEDGE